MGARQLVVGSALLLLFAATGGRAQAPAALVLERKIELPEVQGRLDHLSIDAGHERLFVAALGNGTVEVLDPVAGRRLHTIRGLAEPQGVLVVPARNRLFVANGGDGSVRIFDATSFAPLRSLRLGADADNLRLDPRTGSVWVGYGSGALRSLDGDVRQVEIPLGAHPESFQLEKSGPRAFVNLPAAGTLAVVDRDQGKVIASWRTGDAAANFPLALDEAGRRVFLVCRRPPRLVVLDSRSGAIVAALPTVGDADDVFFDATARRLYVSGGEGRIVCYRQDDPDHYRELAPIETAKGARTSLLSPELGRFFLAVRRNGPSPAGIWVYRTVR